MRDSRPLSFRAPHKVTKMGPIRLMTERKQYDRKGVGALEVCCMWYLMVAFKLQRPCSSDISRKGVGGERPNDKGL